MLIHIYRDYTMFFIFYHFIGILNETCSSETLYPPIGLVETPIQGLRRTELNSEGIHSLDELKKRRKKSVISSEHS